MALDVLHPLTRVAIAGGTACALTLLFTPIVRLAAVRGGWVAKPKAGEDRWGRRIIARLGGAAMFLGFIGAVMLWVPMDHAVITLLIGATLVFGLGLVDDLRRMPPYTKLVAQLLIGSIVVIGGIRVELIPWLWCSIPLSILWFVLVMNAFSLLDNMDGLAAGIGAIASSFCILHAALTGQWTVAMLAAIVTGVCLGFLHYNFPPAKMFMGDSGSHLLGLSLAVLALIGSWRHSTQLLSVLAIPTLVLAVPIFDTCFVTIQRLTHHQHPFTGGTDHVSHRLAILGLSTRQTVLALYVVSACLGLLSVISAHMTTLMITVMWFVIMAVLALFGRYLSQVNVYRLERPSADQLREPNTLIETMLLHKRRLVEVLVDFVLASSAYVAAHLLRFEGVLTNELQQLILRSLPIILVIKVSCFAGCGLYRGVWRYLGVEDLLTVLKAITLGSIFSTLALLYVWRFAGYSRAVLIIDWMLSFFAVGGARVIERLLDEWITASAAGQVPVLIIGAGDSGERVLRYLKYQGKAAGRIVGFLDDDPRKHGNRIHGCAVLGGRERLPAILDSHHVRDVLIAITDPPGTLLEHVQHCCEPRGATWKVVTAGVTDAA